MQNTKIMLLFRTFSKQEIKDFEKFVSSPYFSKGRNLAPLFKILKKYYPSFDSPHLTEEKIFRRLYPRKKYDNVKSGHLLDVLLSEMTSLAEYFLSIEYLKKEYGGYRIHYALSKSLESRNMNNYCEKLILDNIKRIRKYDSGISFFYEMSALYGNLEELFFRDPEKLKKAIDYGQRSPLYIYGFILSNFSRFVNQHNALQSYGFKIYSTELLEMGINGFDHKVFTKECYDDNLGTKELILMLYHMIKSQLNNEDTENYSTAVGIYKNNIDKFNASDKWWYFVGLINISLYRLNIDSKYYSVLGSKLIDFVLEKNITGPEENSLLSYDAYNLIFHFKSLVCTSEELKGFIDSTIEKAVITEQKWLRDFSYARYHFKNKEYEKTLEFISKFSPKNFSMKQIINMLKILSLYSLDYYEEALYSLNSYDQFSRNISKKTGTKRIYTSNFSNSIRSLIMHKLNTEPIDVRDLDKIVEDNKSTMFNFWFSEEAEKLKRQV